MDFFNDIFHNLALLEFYFLNIIYILLYIDFILSIFFQHSNILTRAEPLTIDASHQISYLYCTEGPIKDPCGVLIDWMTLWSHNYPWEGQLSMFTLMTCYDAPPNAKSSITVTSYAGLVNNLLRPTWKTTFKLCITVREINRRPVAPLTKGNDAEGELMLSIYLSGAICNKHNHNG